MKFQMKKDILEKSIARIEAIVPARDMQTLLSNVLLSITTDQVSITASDMESTVRISMPAQNTEPGEIIIRAKKFSEIAKQLKSEEILFSAEKLENQEENDGGYEVRLHGSTSSSARFRMTGNETSHFPVMGQIAANKLSSVSSGIIEEMIQKTIYSISQEDNRYIYNGLCVIADGNKLTIVGTDGRRLSAISRTLSSPISFGDIQGDIVVHAKAIRELQRILDKSPEVLIAVEQRDIFFQVGDSQLSSRLLEGKFPDYKKVIPADLSIQFEIGRETLLNALQQVRVMTEPPSNQVRLALENNSMEILANVPDIGQADIMLPVEYTGERLEIGFNIIYMIEILRALSCPRVRLGVNDASKPIVIFDTEDPDFISLVMPMKI